MRIDIRLIVALFIFFVFICCSSPQLINEVENNEFGSSSCLSDLIVEKYNFQIPFTPDTTTCSLVVPYNTGTLKIYPIKESNKVGVIVRLNDILLEKKSSLFGYQDYYICSPLQDTNRVEISIGERIYTLLITKEVVIKIASWNIANLSKSKTDSELKTISSIIKRYDVVAVQEVNDKNVLERIKTLIPDFEYIVTESKVGIGGYAEYYAFFYKKEIIKVVGSPYVWNDDKDYFVREPFIASFKSGNFTWTMANIHILYGDNEAERRKEINKIDDVIKDLLSNNPSEKDIIFVGDFNFPSNDIGWEMSDIDYKYLIDSSLKTTIKDVSSYDNIWYNSISTIEFKGLYEVYKFDEELYQSNYDLAKNEISDHRPISGIFIINLQGDD